MEEKTARNFKILNNNHGNDSSQKLQNICIFMKTKIWYLSTMQYNPNLEGEWLC